MMIIRYKLIALLNWKTAAMLTLSKFYQHYQTGYWCCENPDPDYMIKRPLNEGSTGYGDLLNLSNGIVLGRNNVSYKAPIEEPDAPFACELGFHIVVDAHYILHASHLSTDPEIHSQQIWRRSGDFGQIYSSFTPKPSAKPLIKQSLDAGKMITSQVLTIDFNHQLLARWSESFDLPVWLQSPNSLDPQMVELSLPSQQRLLARAAYILSLPSQTLTDRLVLEGQTLALCQDLLCSEPLSRDSLDCSTAPLQWMGKPSQIDHAIDIIRHEYGHKLTISSLAQRVGMNECYLKQQFKQHTGKTIARFIRDLRMQEAMRLLLDEHKSVQETAWYVGYRDPSNFSKAFAKFYGITPTQLL